MGYTKELIFRVYDDNGGHYVQVSPDADGLDMVDIRQYDDKGNIEADGCARVTMEREHAVLVCQALTEFLAATNENPQA